jgi:hypothetical protein
MQVFNIASASKPLPLESWCLNLGAERCLYVYIKNPALFRDLEAMLCVSCTLQHLGFARLPARKGRNQSLDQRSSFVSVYHILVISNLSLQLWSADIVHIVFADTKNGKPFLITLPRFARNRFRDYVGTNFSNAALQCCTHTYYWIFSAFAALTTRCGQHIFSGFGSRRGRCSSRILARLWTSRSQSILLAFCS